MTRTNKKWAARGMAAALLLAGGLAGAQERIGEALFVNGVSTAQRPGEAARFLAKGDAITQGDVINTGGRGFAVIGLEDGTKMTLRPNTSFAIDKFSQKPNEESMLMRLLRGGLRAITGAIGKRSSEAVKINTTTATIGIRGTEFDARLCGADCRDEATRAKPVAAGADTSVARVAKLSGSVLAVGTTGEARQLSQGASLFNGELVRTAAGAYAVLAFRDHSKVTVVEKSEMKLENVGFAAGQPDSGSFVVRLVQGGLRALTGLLGKRDPRAVRFETVVATIGIRGTGVDIRLASHCFELAASAPPAPPPAPPRGSKGKKAAAPPTPLPPTPTKVCADDSAYAYTWDGAVGIEAGGGDQSVEKDRAGVFNPRRGKPELLAEVPAFFLDEVAPRPDQVDVDFEQLFGVAHIDPLPDGLYVGVRKGHVDITAAGGVVDLGPWETGILADGSIVPRRAENPGFLFNDPYPTPDVASEQTFRLIELISPGGEPGVGICEMYK